MLEVHVLATPKRHKHEEHSYEPTIDNTALANMHSSTYLEITDDGVQHHGTHEYQAIIPGKENKKKQKQKQNNKTPMIREKHAATAPLAFDHERRKTHKNFRPAAM